MRRLLAPVILVALAVTVACAETTPKPIVHDAAADLAAIGRVRDAYAAAFKAGDAAAIAALFTADGQVMEAGQPTWAGAAGVEAAMKATFGMVTPSAITITAGKTEIVGDVAYETGTFQNSVTMKTGGAQMTQEGRYLVVLRRQADGSWKLVADMGNSATAPPATPAK